MKSKTVFKIDKSSHPYAIITAQVVLFAVGIYFNIHFLKMLVFALVLNTIMFLITSLEEQVVKLEFTDADNQLTISTIQYILKKRQYTVNANELRFNKHDHKDKKHQPLEMFLIFNNGKVLKLTTKLWSREKLVHIANTVFGVVI